MKAVDTLFQQFARFPRVGSVKTRLQPTLSAEEACAVHVELMRLTARSLVDAACGDVELWLDDEGDHPAIADCLQFGVARRCLQYGGDLGARMHNALRDGLARYGAVVLVGSDCPQLDPAYLHAAVGALEDADLVFGPAEDGGFVLVGCSRISDGMFGTIRWGGATTLAESEARVKEMGLRSVRLAMRYDIDTPDDLARWRGTVRRGPPVR